MSAFSEREADEKRLQLGVQSRTIDHVAILAVHGLDGIVLDHEFGVDRKHVELLCHLGDEVVEERAVDRSLQRQLLMGEVELEAVPQVAEDVAVARCGHGRGHRGRSVSLHAGLVGVERPGLAGARESDGIGLRLLHVGIESGDRLVLGHAAQAHPGHADAGVDFVVVEGGVDYDGQHHDGHYGPDSYEKAQWDAPAPVPPIDSLLTQKGSNSRTRWTIQNSRCGGPEKGFRRRVVIAWTGLRSWNASKNSPLGGLLTAGQARRIGLTAEFARNPGGVLSGQSIGDVSHLSRAAVHKQVERLRALGFAIEPVGGAGYRLARSFDDLVAAEAVIPFLLGLMEAAGPPGRSEAPPSNPARAPAWTVGLPYRYLPTCPSTNQALRAVAARPPGPAALPAGALLVTDDQTGGRGRLGRDWVSQPGKDLTFSVLLRPALAPARAHLLSLAAALAVAETLETIPGLEGQVGVKWPNDVLLGGRKVCGILVEGAMDSDRLQWAVAGIGLNVNSDPAAFTRGARPETLQQWAGRPEPVSLGHFLGTDLARAPLLAQLLTRLTERWRDVEGGDLLPGLRQRDVLRGLSVEVLSGPPANTPVVTGEAAGIGEEGQLLVLTADGRQVQVFAGDVTVRSFGKGSAR